jgi:demethylspheroidene O-methyltransferase
VAAQDPPARSGFDLTRWLNRLIARPDIQSLAARLHFSRGVARRDGAEIFEIVQGFVRSQVLGALIELRVLPWLMERDAYPADLAQGAGIAPERMEILLQAGAAMGLMTRRGDGRFRLSRKGAALMGVPGLEAMIRHHHVFYQDMADPVALLRGDGDTGLARFWPYVFGTEGDIPPEDAARYSDLMAQSQELVAQDTLRMIPLRGVSRLMDVGGGSGVFVSHVARRYPRMELSVFDLPEVIPDARKRLESGALDRRVICCAGSFREGPLPMGADAISLIRVLYDHDDDTVTDLLAKTYAALPPGGRLIISEPMSGGAKPDPICDVYFAFYTMAMGTGRTRSAARIAEFCEAVGFHGVRVANAPRSYVTSALSCSKPL